MAVEFRVLGEVEVRVDGRTLVHLSRTHRATGATEAAARALREALAIHLDINAPAREVDEVRALLRELDGPAE